jgi:hypothetical protein
VRPRELLLQVDFLLLLVAPIDETRWSEASEVVDTWLWKSIQVPGLQGRWTDGVVDLNVENRDEHYLVSGTVHRISASPLAFSLRCTKSSAHLVVEDVELGEPGAIPHVRLCLS